MKNFYSSRIEGCEKYIRQAADSGIASGSAYLLRFLEPGIDPPPFYTGHGQAELTDPYNLTYFSRNAVLYHDWDPLNFHRWDIFKNSLISGFSFLIFSLLGVSRTIANLSAIFLNISGLFLFLWGLSSYWDKRKIVLTAVLLLLNSTLFFYGRLPFLENGLIFLFGSHLFCLCTLS